MTESQMFQNAYVLRKLDFESQKRLIFTFQESVFSFDLINPEPFRNLL